MNLKKITALGIIVTGVCVGSIALFSNINTDKQVESEDVSFEVRAGVCASLEAEAGVHNETLTAGVMSVMADTMDYEALVASVSEAANELSAASMEQENEIASIYGFTNLGVANVSSGNLNIREAATTDSKMVGKLPKNAACDILAQEGDWYYVTSGEITGYVSAQYILTGDEAIEIAQGLVRTVAISITDNLNVRTEPNTDASVITTVENGQELEFVEMLDGWVKIAIDSDEGYVSADYVEVKDVLPRALTMTEARYGVGVSDVRVDLVEYALEFVGNPYVWGGTSLTKGADCSGFVLSVFKKYGYDLPHHSGSQANSGTKIKESELLPGDLVFYSNGSRINHVAIYMGGGQVVHASSPKTGIRVSNYKYRKPVKYVRILNDL